ncbi:hypothetical protein PUNSTDRAFT_132024 [Punctularia strigosozonata HHB-11173 SS5]|uniref:uncharacterized protein n=1 Tax=Punctularia strigosozonata (strain HHB-11173) TaxID=741275 RepID=UPI00044176ED|nr:uncharacterized protein PUNSTDRAFT_132024 [Punctularia strigosozonata HHB-11173 SS5]EIN11877.1 hypothetical protein PUNSTDRAFT_132024 [Punctularia strigosozonata HHB-11173 SS5]
MELNVHAILLHGVLVADHKTVTVIPGFLYMHINGKHVRFSARLGKHFNWNS